LLHKTIEVLLLHALDSARTVARTVYHVQDAATVGHQQWQKAQKYNQAKDSSGSESNSYHLCI